MSQSAEQQRRDSLPVCFSDVSGQHQIGGNHVTHENETKKATQHKTLYSMNRDVMGHRPDCTEDHKVKGHCSNTGIPDLNPSASTKLPCRPTQRVS